jgi:general secretion pathway protein J
VRRSPARGFTLVEVMVALLAMAILAALGWRALDGMLRARDGSQEALERILRINTAVVQWEQDLQAVVDVGTVPALRFDGLTLLLTRRADEGVILVAWSVRGSRWQRWAGPVVTRAAELQEGWIRAQSLLGNEAGQVVVAEAAGEWQLYKYIGGRKSNMQSSGDLVPAPAAAASAPALPAREALPEAVEMSLTVDGRTLTRVIALGPAGGA